MIYTTGEQASFVQLDSFWTLVQKVFSHSDNARDEWYKVTDTQFPTHSNIRWYSKYDVLKVFYDYFPDMLTVVTNVTNEGISSSNAPKLLRMLLDEAQMWYLKIELSAYVEVLEDLRNLCYFLEGDGTDMPFKVGARLNNLAEQYPNGQMKELRSTKKLILKVSCIFYF